LEVELRLKRDRIKSSNFGQALPANNGAANSKRYSAGTTGPSGKSVATPADDFASA
jgi:hypothetical protein